MIYLKSLKSEKKTTFKLDELSRCDGRYVQDLGTKFTVPC